MAETSFNAVAGSLNSNLIFKIICAPDEEISTASEFTLTDPISSFDFIIIEGYATVAGVGNRKFSAIGGARFNAADIGHPENFLSCGIYYNNSYNCCVGFTLKSETKIGVGEISNTGYTSIRGVTIYGVKIL